jgi:hypothetical protein
MPQGAPRSNMAQPPNRLGLQESTGVSLLHMPLFSTKRITSSRSIFTCSGALRQVGETHQSKGTFASVSGSWYFTAPWDPVPIRRGDALGLRAGADYFADMLAPGLSNGASDARWISILSWCLKWSHIVWQYAGGRDLSQRDDQRARYAWLRPLELLWVDRTLASGQNTGRCARLRDLAFRGARRRACVRGEERSCALSSTRDVGVGSSHQRPERWPATDATGLRWHGR